MTARREQRRPVWMDEPSAVVQLLKIVVIAVIVVVMLYPFLYVVASSFATPEAATAGGLLPTQFSLEAYRNIFAGDVVTHALLVSVGITVVGTVLSVTLTVTTAYGLTRTRDVPGSRFALYLVLLTMLFGAGIIPQYLLVRSLGLINSYWSLILPGLLSAFNLIVVRNFFMNIPRDILESARMDGAAEPSILGRIVLPLSKPVVAVVALFYAVGYWNNFFNAMLYLNDNAKWPIQQVLNHYVVQGVQLSTVQDVHQVAPPPQTIQMAVVVLATVPILVVYPFAQRYFTQGVLTGAIKG